MALPSQGSIGAQPWSLLQACLWVPYSSSGSQDIDPANLEADPERQSRRGTRIPLYGSPLSFQKGWGWGTGSWSRGREQENSGWPGLPLGLIQGLSSPVGLDEEPQSSCASCTRHS